MAPAGSHGAASPQQEPTICVSSFRDRGEDPPAPDHPREDPPEPITAELLLGWFNEALGQDDPKPPPTALVAMAAKINNLTERPGGGRNPMQEECARRFISLWDAAMDFRAAYAAYLEITPSPSPANPTFDVFSGVDELLRREGVGDAKHNGAPKLGRPEADWHPVGHAVATLIVTAMDGIGYGVGGRGRRAARQKRTLDKTNEDSVTAQVGAALIRHIFRLPDDKPSALGFASAMKHRNRSKKPAFFQLLDRSRVLD